MDILVLQESKVGLGVNLSHKLRHRGPETIQKQSCISAAAAAKSLQSCPALCDPINGSPPGSPVPGSLQGKNTGVGCHFLLQCMKVKSESDVAQSGPTLSDPMDCSSPGSSVHGIFQARVLDWGAIAFSSQGFLEKEVAGEVKVAQLCPTLCNPMDYTVHGILQARILEEVAFPFANPGIEPRCPEMQVDSLPAELLGKLKEMATHSSILAWRISWTEEPGGLQSIEWQRVGHD